MSFSHKSHFVFQTHLGQARSRSLSRGRVLKRKREESAMRSTSRARSSSRTPRDKSGVRDDQVSKLPLSELISNGCSPGGDIIFEE